MRKRAKKEERRFAGGAEGGREEGEGKDGGRRESNRGR
jgi:hypothetical protein